MRPRRDQRHEAGRGRSAVVAARTRVRPAGAVHSRATLLLTGAASVLLTACGSGPGQNTAAARGNRAFAQGDYDQALAEYLLAVREDSTAENLARAAHTYVALGRVDEARLHYQAAVSAEDGAWADQAAADFLALARDLNEEGDSYGAAYAREVAVAFRPGAGVDQLAAPLARHYQEAGEHVRALALWTRGAGVNDPDEVHATGRAYQEIGDCVRALAYYQRLRELAPRRAAEVRSNEGTCHYELALEREEAGDLQEAVRYLNVFLQEFGEPRSLRPQAYYKLGEAYEELGMCQEAATAYRMATQAGVAGSSDLARRAEERENAIRFGGGGGSAPC